MNRKENAARIIKLLSETTEGVHKRTLMRKLSINSDSSFYRVLAVANRLPDVVIVCNNKVYTIQQSGIKSADDPFVPTDDELISLVSLQHILSTMTSGNLREIFEPLQKKLTRYLKRVDVKAAEWPDHIKILDIHFRKIGEGIFNEIVHASAHRRVIKFSYTDSQGKKTNPTVSPQQLVRYKDNWYLDAWCHLNKGLRIFSLDNINDIRHVNQKFYRPDIELIKRIYATSYGLFSGEPANTAIVRFTGLAARYALRETWHPQQKLIRLAGGSVQLEIPYKKPQELIKEILSWGGEAEVIGPEELREEVATAIEKAAARYAPGVMATVEDSIM